MDIKTFVFLDSETTGLPSLQNNTTRMTELCFTAVQTDHIRLSVSPRVRSKVSFCFNPQKTIDAIASKMSGLSNSLLESQPEFTSTAFDIIQNFLNMQPKPICFVAHNGDLFDYPILRTEIQQTGNKLPEDILCIDSLTAFRELHDQAVKKESICEIPVNDLENPISTLQTQNNSMSNVRGRKRNNTSKRNGNKWKRPLKKPSFKLVDVYKRLTSKKPTDAHKAEYDVTMMIECAAVLGKGFVDWSNLNAKKFSDIPMMTPGKENSISTQCTTFPLINGTVQDLNKF